MTEGEERKQYKAFIEQMKKADNGRKLIGELKDRRDPQREKAMKGLEEYVRLALLINPQIRYTPQDLKNPQFISEVAKQGIEIYEGRASNMLREDKDLEAIVSQAEDKVLNVLSRVGEIQGAVEGKYSEVIERFSYIETLKDFSKKYESGAKVDKKVVHDVAARGAAEAIRKKLADEGESKYVQEIAAAMTARAVKERRYDESAVEKYAKEGFKAEIKQAQKSYDEIAEKKEKDAYSLIRGALKKLSKGSEKEFETAKNLIYAANEGQIKFTSKPQAAEAEDDEGLAMAA